MLGWREPANLEEMEEWHPLQQLLRLNIEASSLDAKIDAAVCRISEADTAEADRALFRDVYANLVGEKKELNAMRAALTTQLAGEGCGLLHGHLPWVEGW